MSNPKPRVKKEVRGVVAFVATEKAHQSATYPATYSGYVRAMMRDVLSGGVWAEDVNGKRTRLLRREWGERVPTPHRLHFDKDSTWVEIMTGG